MKSYFRKKIELELRIRKWKEIEGNEPDSEYLITSFQMCIFRLNSTK